MLSFLLVYAHYIWWWVSWRHFQTSISGHLIVFSFVLSTPALSVVSYLHLPDSFISVFVTDIHKLYIIYNMCTDAQKIFNLCLSESDLFCLIRQPVVELVFLQTSWFYSLWRNLTPLLYVYPNLLHLHICKGHLGCLHDLAVVSSAAINTYAVCCLRVLWVQTQEKYKWS